MCQYEKYNAEFKLMITKLYKTGHSIKDSSREYDVSIKSNNL